jgi:DNA-directed RNA polymerase subunit RPC12/RpoP
MTDHDCSACGADTPRRLDGTSADKTCWYWRCDHCGHLWTVSKTDDSDIRQITPLQPKGRVVGRSLD